MSALADGGDAPPDVTGNVVRALVLYALAEVQAGHGSTLRVQASGAQFSVADDGRGHAVARSVAGVPYLSLVYTHLDYPFSMAEGPPVQLHTIGLSFINTLCRHLAVTVHMRDRSLQRTYHHGALVGEETLSRPSPTTGTVISGELDPQLPHSGVDLPRLQRWLLTVAAANPGVRIVFNDRLLSTPPTDLPDG